MADNQEPEDEVEIEEEETLSQLGFDVEEEEAEGADADAEARAEETEGTQVNNVVMQRDRVLALIDPDMPRTSSLSGGMAATATKARMDALGDEYEHGVYLAKQMGELLKGVCADVESVHPRQDVHAKLGPVTAAMEGTPYGWSDILKLLVAAHTLDAGFQAKAAEAFKEVTGAEATKPPAATPTTPAPDAL